ncbi:MAG: hypothetical protein IPJ65_37420 [Archangiaceae bacterium]|nr:hypothetical protein [Archangiaceae bacterium]
MIGDYDWIGPAIGAVAKGVNSYASAGQANDVMQEAYRKMLENLQARFSDYDKLGTAGYQDIAAQQLGPSALEASSMTLPRARPSKSRSRSSLSSRINGGLSLSDLKVLNEVQGNLNRNNSARQAGLANSPAARGQLGSGAQLAMDMQNQSDAAMNANAAGESAAAQAQARAMQAILQKGQMARGMANDDYGRKSDAARAADMIAARNAAARTDAAKANNSYRGRGVRRRAQTGAGQNVTHQRHEQRRVWQPFGQRHTIKGRASAISGDIDNAVSAFSAYSKNKGGSGSGPRSGETYDEYMSRTQKNWDTPYDGGADEDAGCHHRRGWAPLSPESPGTRAPLGDLGTVLRPSRQRAEAAGLMRSSVTARAGSTTPPRSRAMAM